MQERWPRREAELSVKLKIRLRIFIKFEIKKVVSVEDAAFFSVVFLLQKEAFDKINQ